MKSRDVLTPRYGPIPAQAAVAGTFYAGRSVEEAASALGMSRNAVRPRLTRIFRMEVLLQAELQRRLAIGGHAPQRRGVCTARGAVAR